jgi:hypothetical protein
LFEEGFRASFAVSGLEHLEILPLQLETNGQSLADRCVVVDRQDLHGLMRVASWQ